MPIYESLQELGSDIGESAENLTVQQATDHLEEIKLLVQKAAWPSSNYHEDAHKEAVALPLYQSAVALNAVYAAISQDIVEPLPTEESFPERRRAELNSKDSHIRAKSSVFEYTIHMAEVRTELEKVQQLIKPLTP